MSLETQPMLDPSLTVVVELEGVLVVAGFEDLADSRRNFANANSH
ncbi:hypothetical protein AB4089_15610 [Arthrobacter sp. 2MCAF15]